MQDKPQTTVGEMKRVERNPPSPVPEIQWRTKPKRSWAEELLKNIGVAAALVICAVAVRSGSVGQADWSDALLAAATGDTLLDDQLGKLTFVSTLFPEATLVFGETAAETLAQPLQGGSVVHAWSQQEPYLTYQGTDASVQCAIDGEVMGVYHAEDEALMIRVRRADGLECCYGGLSESLVSTGDAVRAGQLLGVGAPSGQAVLEVRRDGYSVDPTAWMQE